jgi:hypothetical protein
MEQEIESREALDALEAVLERVDRERFFGGVAVAVGRAGLGNCEGLAGGEITGGDSAGAGDFPAGSEQILGSYLPESCRTSCRMGLVIGCKMRGWMAY